MPGIIAIIQLHWISLLKHKVKKRDKYPNREDHFYAIMFSILKYKTSTEQVLKQTDLNDVVGYKINKPKKSEVFLFTKTNIRFQQHHSSK